MEEKIVKVVSFGTYNFNAKGIPCSRIVVLKNILTAVVIDNPNSEKSVHPDI
jgi:hypothetical protein